MQPSLNFTALTPFTTSQRPCVGQSAPSKMPYSSSAPQTVQCYLFDHEPTEKSLPKVLKLCVTMEKGNNYLASGIFTSDSNRKHLLLKKAKLASFKPLVLSPIMNFTILQQANSPYQDSRENKAYVYKPSSGRHPLPAGIYAWCKYIYIYIYIIDINHKYIYIYICAVTLLYWQWQPSSAPSE